MALSIKFKVHSVRSEQVQSTSVVKGETVPSQVQGYVVELASDQCSSVTLYYVSPSEVAEAKEKFVLGEELVWTI